MPRSILAVVTFACGCMDYQFEVVADHAGLEGETGSNVDGAGGFLADTAGTGTGKTPLSMDDTGGGGGGDDEDAVCAHVDNLTEWLDTFQVAGDGHVLYCHGTGNGGYVLVDSNISSCFPHLDHRYDVFPSTGCDS